MSMCCILPRWSNSSSHSTDLKPLAFPVAEQVCLLPRIKSLRQDLLLHVSNTLGVFERQNKLLILLFSTVSELCQYFLCHLSLELTWI